VLDCQKDSLEKICKSPEALLSSVNVVNNGGDYEIGRSVCYCLCLCVHLSFRHVCVCVHDDYTVSRKKFPTFLTVT